MQEFDNPNNQNEFDDVSNLNEFRGKFKNMFPFSNARKNMIRLYEGTKEQEWFLQEIGQSLESVVSYRSGIEFISNIYEKLKDTSNNFDNSVYSHYALIIEYPEGVFLLSNLLNKNKDDSKTIRFIEDILADFEKFKGKDNYFLLFDKILKIYKDYKQLKEILVSFELTNEEDEFRYLERLVNYIPIEEIVCLKPYIENSLEHIKTKLDSDIVALIIEFAPEKIAKRLIKLFIVHIELILTNENSLQILISLLERVDIYQMSSLQTAFDIFLRTNNSFVPNFDYVTICFLEAMSWQKRFKFFSTHYDYLKHVKSEYLDNLLNFMTKNEHYYWDKT